MNNRQFLKKKAVYFAITTEYKICPPCLSWTPCAQGRRC